MRVKLVVNEPVKNLSVRDVLLSLIDIREYQEMRIAVSYVKYSGVMSIRSKFGSFVKGGGRIRLLFGDDFDISESAALRLLLRLGVELRLYVASAGENYHPKMWIFEGKRDITSLTGSSNLSEGALTTNVETDVLIERAPRVIKKQIDYFEHLWKNCSKRDIDDEWIDHYVDIERNRSADFRYKRNGLVDHGKSYAQLARFIEGWMRHIRTGRKIERYERWRGWYFIPEPAVIDDSRLVGFKNILLAIRSSKEYQRRGVFTLSVRSTDRLLKRAKITYKGHGLMTQTPDGRRNLFIRQHKNYLDILGFVTTVDNKGPRISVTSLGSLLAKANTPSKRKAIFTKTLYGVRWPWAPKLKLFDFLVRLMEHLPQKRLYYNELSYLVIHAEHNLMFIPILNLVRMFRSLPNRDRLKLIDRFELKLETELSRKNKWAYYRYQRKIRELMSMLSYANGISYHGDRTDREKYIELVSGSPRKRGARTHESFSEEVED